MVASNSTKDSNENSNNFFAELAKLDTLYIVFDKMMREVIFAFEVKCFTK